MRFLPYFLLGWAAIVTGPTTGMAQVEAGPGFYPGYEARPGDLLRISVWPDESMSGEYTIEDNGMIHLPVLGSVQVAGKDLATIRSELRGRYGEAMRTPVVSVTPLFPVSALGAVVRPGLYRVEAYQTLFDVISMAGGLRADADEENIRLLRDGEIYSLNAAEVFEEGGEGLNIGLRSGDRIVVPEEGFSIGMSDVWQVLQTVAVAIALVRNFN